MAVEVKGHQEGLMAVLGFPSLQAVQEAADCRIRRSLVRPRRAPQGHDPRWRQLSLMKPQALVRIHPQQQSASATEMMSSGPFWNPPSSASGSSS